MDERITLEIIRYSKPAIPNLGLITPRDKMGIS